MIDVEKVKQAYKFLTRYVTAKRAETGTQSGSLNEIEVLIYLAEQVLSAKVPEKKEYIVGKYESNKYAEGFNDCHDQFPVLIARDYVRRDELPTEDEIISILGGWDIDYDAPEISKSIHSRMMKGKTV